MSFLDSIKNSKLVRWFMNLLKSIKLPGMNGITLYELLSVYISGISELELGNRVSGISWRLFISLFPFILFFLMLIRNLPYYDQIGNYLHDEVLTKVLPPSVIGTTWAYLTDRQNIINQEFSDSSFLTILVMIIIFLFSSTMGINSLISGLNFREEDENRNRSTVKQFSTALYLTIYLTVLLIFGMLIFYYTDVIGAIMEKQNLVFFSNPQLMDFIKYFLFALLYFTAICAVYYIGPKSKLRLKQIYPGAIFTTILYLISISLLGIYFSNFTRYNLLYGSLGSILIIMIALYINVMLIIIGYQLNLSIIQSRNTFDYEKE